MKIGNRYRTAFGNIVEIIDIKTHIYFQVIQINSDTSYIDHYKNVGDIFRKPGIPEVYVYLGDFSKPNEFEELYNLFNS